MVGGGWFLFGGWWLAKKPREQFEVEIGESTKQSNNAEGRVQTKKEECYSIVNKKAGRGPRGKPLFYTTVYRPIWTSSSGLGHDVVCPRPAWPGLPCALQDFETADKRCRNKSAVGT